MDNEQLIVFQEMLRNELFPELKNDLEKIMLPKVITIKEASKMIKKSEAWIKYSLEEENIPYTKLGSHYMFLNTELMEWFAERTKQKRQKEQSKTNLKAVKVKAKTKVKAGANQVT